MLVYQRVLGIICNQHPRHLVNDTNILTVLSMIRSSDSVEHLKCAGPMFWVAAGWPVCFGGAV